MDLPDTLQPSVGLVPAEAKLAATKRSASLFSSLLFSSLYSALWAE
jgi:hypothetical protein